MISAVNIGVAIGIRVVLIAFCFYLLVQLVRQLADTRRWNTVLIIALICSYIIPEVVQVAILVVRPTEISLYGTDAYSGILVGFFLILFLDSYASSSLHIGKAIGATLLGTITMLLVVLVNLDQLRRGVVLSLWVGPLVSLYFFFVLFTGLHTLRQLKRYLGEVQRRAVNQLYLFLSLSFGLVTVIIVGANIVLRDESGAIEVTDTSFFWAVIAPPLLYLISLFFLHRGYIRHRSPAFLQPQRIDRFIIIDKEVGIPVYDLRGNVEENVDEALLSGAITAISAVLREATNISGDLRYIQIGDKSLMFRSNDDAFCILFTSQPTLFLTEAMTKIMERLGGEKYSGVNFSDLSNDDIQRIDRDVRRALGYI